MHIESFRDYCLSLPHVEEDFPFGDQYLVFKIGGKMFAITNLANEIFEVNLKCDPHKAIELRERHDEIRPGFHMNKKHWNTINFEGNLSDERLKKLVKHSYDLVYSGLTKKMKAELGEG